MGTSTSKITPQDQAILDLKTQRDKLHQYQKRIQSLTTRETEIAKQLLAQNDKPRALLALRRKKYQQSLLAQTDSQLEQLEKLVSSVEFALIQKDIVFGLQQGTKVLKEIHKEMGGIENVEKLMGETADAIAYQQEVSELIGGRISTHDEEEVEAELEALAAEVTGTGKTKTPAEELPSVPNTGFPSRQQEPARQEEQQAKVAERREALLT
ncbi:charged multivesicular body protein 6 [Podospora fimiseda]|uniref:Charged multivesicular body protein 6 n=1 Tax=Podospora fimiseda TaxID=252190 RepID=A0AAN7BS27_9PEZI|nr:charged multivesicular body protein 6 [Podospora fimiseda]